MYLANLYIAAGHCGTYAVVANQVYVNPYSCLFPTNWDKNCFNGLTKHKVKRYGKDKSSETSA